MLSLSWLIPALPLAGFALLVLFGRRLGEPLAGWFATAVVAASFLVTVGVFLAVRTHNAEHTYHQHAFDWVVAGGFKVSVGFLVDPLSMTMCLFITGVAALIHLYSIGYMHGDPRYSKFFLYLNLFVASMLVLVLGDSLLLTFVGWEGVGACSYFLISFWHESEANATAGKKAFITNRVGDWGFMVAMFLLFATIGTVNYSEIFARTGSLSQTTASAVMLLLFLGACGKSAQIPLYLWLPDAMAGPTPVSALIHAATMVTSGVFLLVRMSPVLSRADDTVLWVIAGVGAFTALFAATIAVAQNDIKKVLAYSTVSQLGYMFLAVGSGAYVAAIFHMITHAFFKALLFLGAGSVIHGMDGEQDMRRMGALFKPMKITAVTFIVGALAISGIFPFAGFWSKDDILLAAWNRGPAGKVLWGMGVAAAFLTAFYMGRQVFLVFFGKARWNEPLPDEAPAPPVGSDSPSEGQAADEPAAVAVAQAQHDVDVHPHESPWTMTSPLVVLAGLATVGGLINLPVLSRTLYLEHWLEPAIAAPLHLQSSTGMKIGLSVLAVTIALGGIALAYSIYLRRAGAGAEAIERPVLAKGWYYDSTITAFMGGPGRKLFEGVAWFDRTVVDGAVNGVAAIVRDVGSGTRRLQTGYVRSYALGIAAGAVVVAGLFLTRVVF